MASIVPPAVLRHFVRVAFTCLLVVVPSLADNPQFSLTALDGQTLTSSSLRGNVVLLQFWTTWCPVCRRDQPAVEAVQSAFGGQGLVVVAVNVGEPEDAVRKYLQAAPRSCPVVLNGRDLATRFGVHSYPHYVVIDRNGNVVASKAGGGGEAWLRYLLRGAGLGAATQTQVAGAAPAPSTGGGGPQWTNVGVVASAPLAKPLPKTIFVFVDGEQLEADHYTLSSNFLRVTADGQERSIPVDSLDVKKTVAVNRQRGIDVKIPTGRNELFLAF